MAKILFFYLKILKSWQSFLLRIRGKTRDDIHEERIISGKAWEEFCDNLKTASAVLKYPGTPRDAFNQAEGIRYLSRLTRGGLEAFLEYCDPSFPVFRRTAHETIKLGADNPDNYYFNAQISGEFEYRIRGKRNTVHYIGFFTQNGSYGTTGGMKPCGVLEYKDIYCDQDGSFEIILSRENKGRNWLKIESETSMVMARQTFLNRFTETPAEILIENLNGQKSPGILTPAMIDEGLRTASMFVGGASLLFARWAQGFQNHTNRLPLFDQETSNAAGGDAGIIYYHSYWKLNDNEALLIRVRPPECESWNFQLNNYWMESLDYRYFTVCINKASARYEADGSVKVLVSHNDPGHPNWINTCGHHEGTMLWRWYRIKPGDKAVEPGCRLITVQKQEEK